MYNPGKQGQLLSKRRRSFGADENRSLSIDFENIRGMGIGIKDLIAPSSMQFFPKYMRLGRKYVRVMRISELPNMLSDEFFVRLTDVSFNMVTTINIRPMQNKEASALVTKNLTLAQSAKRDSLKALAGENLSEEFVPLGIREQVDRAMDLRSDMINEDEKLFKTTYTLMFYADSMEELSQYTEEIISNCQGDVVGCEIMYDYQEEGFNTTMPLLDVEIPYHRRRTLKSTSVATMALPFSNLELNDKDGINYSQNLHTRSLILYNRLLTQNYNGFILGTPGSGKSLQAKVEMLNVLLGSNSDLIVIDPEAEYLALSKLVGGETIKIEPGGRWHINPMEINSSYQWTNEDDTEETNPILAKADFILKLMEVIVKSPFGMNSVQETIIDECVRKLYEPFIDSRGRLMKIPPEDMPTLTDLQIALAERPEMEAKELAIALKLYTGKGSLNTFGFRSNVNLHDRCIGYNRKDIGDKLKPIAMLIILDSILNRLMENRRKGKNTWFWVDEIYLLFADERSAAFLNMLYKRARKYGGVPTGLTQNVEDLLESDTARKMLSNCNFVMMLNQAPNDREKLADLLNLSASQIDVITSAPAGQGLIFTGSNCVPFASTFPKYQKDGVTPNPIYKVLTSNMKEITEFEKADKRKQILERRQERGA
jgi:type IV secretory pathway VirB4 component